MKPRQSDYGKGDFNRSPTNKFRDNYDRIHWGKSGKAVKAEEKEGSIKANLPNHISGAVNTH
jgi:hypothetical protein